MVMMLFCNCVFSIFSMGFIISNIFVVVCDSDNKHSVIVWMIPMPSGHCRLVVSNA